jgi:hypothetical protein
LLFRLLLLPPPPRAFSLEASRARCPRRTHSRPRQSRLLRAGAHWAVHAPRVRSCLSLPLQPYHACWAHPFPIIPTKYPQNLPPLSLPLSLPRPLSLPECLPLKRRPRPSCTANRAQTRHRPSTAPTRFPTRLWPLPGPTQSTDAADAAHGQTSLATSQDCRPPGFQGSRIPTPRITIRDLSNDFRRGVTDMVPAA